MWDSEKQLLRQLRGGTENDPTLIQNLTELPIADQKMPEPQPFHPIGEPKKKTKYRPPVPRFFQSGYDVFLDRR